MTPLSGLEARLVGALALFGSALLHAGALLFASPLEPPREDVRVEVVVLDESARDDDATALPAPSPPVVDERDEASPPAAAPPDPAQLHWRERLALREAEHQRHLEVKARRVAALEQAGAQRAPSVADPEAVYLCGAEGPGARLDVTSERDASAYAGVMPSGLFPGRYVEGMSQVRTERTPQRRGRWRFALPAEVLPIALDAPKGALLAAGRDDARCLVGVELSRGAGAGVFPIRFFGVPVRIVDEQDRVSSALVDVRLYDDATFELELNEGGPLPFTRGALYDHEAVGRNLREHYVGARALSDLARVLLGE